MADWEYIRLMNRNYLQLRLLQEPEDSFQYKMLLNCPIKGILNCKERDLNGKVCLMFDISSKQNIRNLYDEQKLDFVSFYQIIYSLKSIAANMRLYLLEVENLILYPEFVFQELDTKELSFVYCPNECVHETGTVKNFYQFLLSVIDHEDIEFTEIIYDMYDTLGDELSVQWLEMLYDKLCDLQEKRLSHNKEEIAESEEICIVTPQQECVAIEYKACPDVNGNLSYPASGFSLDKKWIPVIGCYIGVVGIALYYLYSGYNLSLRENIVTWAGVTVATALFAFSIFVFSRKRKEVLKKDWEDADEYDEKASYTDVYENDNNQPEDYGKTVYFEAEEIENKLYGIGNRNRKVIELNKFPFVIGKKEGVVDGVIEDASVSRMHACFKQDAKNIFLEDLNSTNGTYKNGIMLMPHEKVTVFPEDEIRFGKLRFVYR